MSAFVISFKDNGKLKYTFNSRKGSTLLTSMEYPSTEAIYTSIHFLKKNFEKLSFYKFKTPGGKFFFKIALADTIYASSRRFNTELRFEKGIQEVQNHFLEAEILDFTVNIFEEERG